MNIIVIWETSPSFHCLCFFSVRTVWLQRFWVSAALLSLLCLRLHRSVSSVITAERGYSVCGMQMKIFSLCTVFIDGKISYNHQRSSGRKMCSVLRRHVPITHRQKKKKKPLDLSAFLVVLPCFTLIYILTDNYVNKQTTHSNCSFLLCCVCPQIRGGTKDWVLFLVPKYICWFP